MIPEEESKWCEVWLRIDSLEEDIQAFDELLEEHHIESTPNIVTFPERAVKIVKVNRNKLVLLSRYSDHIAEYRLAKESASFWTEMPPREQTEWVNDLVDRIIVPTPDVNVSICILDTGVTHGHSLLSPILTANDCQTADVSWGTHDHNGHGTMMAGVTAYGDLEACLASTENITLQHQLESVKILPPAGQNHPRLWGYMTSQGINLATIQAPNRTRISCMAITSSDTRDRGRPSSWSATIDNLTSGVEDDIQRLMILSAGNAEDFNNPANYPNILITDSIHDPAQSWNAITVGAYTALTAIKDPTLTGYASLAPHNAISPFTTTSLVWEDKWAIKPEIVMEGGNLAADNTLVTECADLSMLTTNFDPLHGHFIDFNMTSLATAQASWFAAQIQVEYPEFWPETIRALMIHSARWTEELTSQFKDNSLTDKQNIKNLLRICGYGVPSLERALYSASNSLTLIVEEEIQPFIKEEGKYKTKDMHFYELPWPKEVLQSLPPEVDVEMRVTLSYFIEPGPGELGGKDKYRYASHMLRFELNSPGETEDELIQRINIDARDDANTHPGTQSASDHWVIGANARNKGSIHSDIWKGTAAELAGSNKIVIYPAIGWWRERKRLGKYNKKTRYSLVVSISTPSEDVDIYTPVLTQVEVPATIEIGV
ncbi:MAG: S8 family peptidase [Sulfurovum sp.]|nr:S8 family peptidase [Sulfurovum sp.]